MNEYEYEYECTRATTTTTTTASYDCDYDYNDYNDYNYDCQCDYKWEYDYNYGYVRRKLPTTTKNGCDKPLRRSLLALLRRPSPSSSLSLVRGMKPSAGEQNDRGGLDRSCSQYQPLFLERELQAYSSCQLSRRRLQRRASVPISSRRCADETRGGNGYELESTALGRNGVRLENVRPGLRHTRCHAIFDAGITTLRHSMMVVRKNMGCSEIRDSWPVPPKRRGIDHDRERHKGQ